MASLSMCHVSWLDHPRCDRLTVVERVTHLMVALMRVSQCQVDWKQAAVVLSGVTVTVTVRDGAWR